MDRSGTTGGRVAWKPAGKRELRKELFEPGFILADVRIDLAIRPFKVGIGDDGRAAMARTTDVDHVEVIFLDDAIQVHINEILTRRRAPMTEQHVLDVRKSQRLFQEWIVVQVNLSHRQIVGGAPVSVHLAQEIGGEGILTHESRTLEIASR